MVVCRVCSFGSVYTDSALDFITKSVHHLHECHLSVHAALKGILDGSCIKINFSFHQGVKCRIDVKQQLVNLGIDFNSLLAFSVDSKGAEVLYETVREYIGDIDNQVVFDLFSGTGTIGQVLAPVAKKVIGVEIIEEAVEAAKENAVRNGLSNCRFIAGDVFKVLDEIEEKPDVIVLDPPRDGIHPKALPKILNYGVDKIVYISCKMTSLARDLEMMQLAGYRVEKMTAVDQFCETVHVEVVCCLHRVNS